MPLIVGIVLVLVLVLVLVRDVVILYYYIATCDGLCLRALSSNFAWPYCLELNVSNETHKLPAHSVSVEIYIADCSAFL